MDVYKVNRKSFQKRWKIVLREQLQQTKTKYWMQLLQSFSSTDAFFWNVHWRMKKSADVCEVCGKHLRQTFLMLRVQRVRVMRTGRKVNRVIKRTEKTKSKGHRKRDFSSKSFCYLFLEACAGRQEGCRYVWRVWETFWDPGNLEASLMGAYERSHWGETMCLQRVWSEL